MTTIVCGVDDSPAARAAVRIAALLAESIGARLVAVHVLAHLTDADHSAKHVAAAVLYDEVPDADATARGEVGDVAERLAAVALDEDAMLIVLGADSRGGRSRACLSTRHAAELAEMTTVPILIAPLQLGALDARRGQSHDLEEAHR
ncbi:MAG TPA: universal stress protein [Gaiellaceae bacterium]|jgi:nucleotide-binding universal stress UspA family protein|nr:universal stress protein [Gaiellaceae bacterium]